MTQVDKYALTMKILSKIFPDASSRNRGFTLLLAALVASVVLALGASIFSIAQKQITLSSLGRDSQFAFYAADTAAECALYWDLRNSSFADLETVDTFTQAAIQCDGVSVLPTFEEIDGSVITVFRIENLFEVADEEESGNCVDVTVSKNPEKPFTVIRADGYSLPCALLSESGRSLQRSVELKY